MILTRLPFVGSVFAGRSVPLDAVPIIRFLDVVLLKTPRLGERLALCRVIGDSMMGDGIYDGDVVVYSQTPLAYPGQMVLAATPHGNTVKRYWPDGDGGVWLRCSNPEYDDQYWQESDIRILGIVKQSLHNIS